jgi:hypothetical protein
MVALAFLRVLGVTGLLPATPPEPVPAGAIPIGTTGTVALVAVALVALLGWITLRPALLRRTGGPTGRFQGDGAGAALLVTWCAVAAVLWVRNPYAAALLVPGAHALLAVIAPEVRLRRPGRRPRRGGRRAVRTRRPVARRPARGCRRRTSAGSVRCCGAGGVVGPWLGHLEPSCWPAWWPPLLVALRSRASVAAKQTPQDHRARGPSATPGRLAGGTESALRR